jgi:uncharacterized OsmC-like protein
MTQEEIKLIQKPFKEKYKSYPESAVVNFSVSSEIGDNVTCRIKTGELFKEAGLHPAAGGSGIHLCSAEMLLESITACAGVTLNAVALSMGINIRSAKICAEGDLDFRGTLAVSKEAPVGFKSLRLTFDIDADADDQKISKLISLTEKYCVVYQTLINTPEIDIKLSERKAVGF